MGCRLLGGWGSTDVLSKFKSWCWLCDVFCLRVAWLLVVLELFCRVLMFISSHCAGWRPEAATLPSWCRNVLCWCYAGSWSYLPMRSKGSCRWELRTVFSTRPFLTFKSRQFIVWFGCSFHVWTWFGFQWHIGQDIQCPCHSCLTSSKCHLKISNSLKQHLTSHRTDILACLLPLVVCAILCISISAEWLFLAGWHCGCKLKFLQNNPPIIYEK